MINNPYYLIDFSSVNCFLEMRVNDVPVFCMNLEGQVSTIIPINQAILESGKQQVSYNILPLLGETSLRNNTRFEASVWLYDASGDEIEKKEEINQFAMPENTGIPLPAYKGENFFTAEVPYKLDAWQNSQDLTKVEDLRLYVDLFYSEIEEMIANGQYDRFAKLIQKREDNIATAMYLSEEEKKKRVAELVNTIKTGFKVVPTSSKDVMLIYGYDKLVSLKKSNGEPALSLINEEEGDEIIIELQLHLPQGSADLLVI